MKPPIETVRISQRGKEILINAKRKTGIEHWNVLCRWALCASLNVTTPPKPERATEDSNIEIAWKVFAGSQAELLTGLIKTRYAMDVKTPQTGESDYFRAHLERGITYLQSIKTLEQLCSWPSSFSA